MNFKKSLILLTAVILIFSMSGCKAFTDGFTEGLKQSKSSETTQPTTIEALGLPLSITVPSGWEEAEGLHDNAQIQAKSGNPEGYILIIAEDKSDFTDSMTLRDYYDIIKSNFSNSLTDLELGSDKPHKINGFDAIQIQIKGTASNVKLIYLVSCVETDEYFAQIITWTINSKFEEIKPEFESIINSFNTTDGSNI